jgi:hypothetical protein
VDASDSFDLASASAAGADLERLLWVRCHGVEEALKSVDLLLHGGGWGAVVLDLSDASPRMVRKIPMSWWYRFRLAVEGTSAAFVVVEREPYVKNSAALMLEFPLSRAVWSGEHMNFRVLRSVQVDVAARKPVRSRRAGFRAKARV